jgi:GntR family transcriptional regulator
MPEINRELPRPLYQQIKSIWKTQIEQGLLRPGDKIPTERELCQRYGVSQITVKQAITALVQEGLLVRRPRTGTFVARPQFHQQLLRLTSFSEDMIQRGLVPGARVLDRREQPAGPAVAAALNTADHDPVVCLERVRLADDEPLAIEVFHTPAALCPGLLTEELDGRSLYQLLQEKYGLAFAQAEESFEASSATSREARLLGLRRGAPVLRAERLTFDTLGRPVEFTRSVYRGDKYKLHAVMSRNV